MNVALIDAVIIITIYLYNLWRFYIVGIVAETNIAAYSHFKIFMSIYTAGETCEAQFDGMKH